MKRAGELQKFLSELMDEAESLRHTNQISMSMEERVLEVSQQTAQLLEAEQESSDLEPSHSPTQVHMSPCASNPLGLDPKKVRLPRWQPRVREMWTQVSRGQTGVLMDRASDATIWEQIPQNLVIVGTDEYSGMFGVDSRGVLLKIDVPSEEE